jgi:hydrogenase maturation protein HypF
VEAAGAIAARFHHGLADVVAAIAARIRDGGGPSTVALGGGVFANAILVAACEERLERRGFAVLRPTRVPPNDGGLALGQLHVAAARARRA